MSKTKKSSSFLKLQKEPTGETENQLKPKKNKRLKRTG
jgi:hypothetical protein